MLTQHALISPSERVHWTPMPTRSGVSSQLLLDWWDSSKSRRNLRKTLFRVEGRTTWIINKNDQLGFFCSGVSRCSTIGPTESYFLHGSKWNQHSSWLTSEVSGVFIALTRLVLSLYRVLYISGIAGLDSLNCRNSLQHDLCDLPRPQQPMVHQ